MHTNGTATSGPSNNTTEPTSSHCRPTTDATCAGYLVISTYTPAFPDLFPCPDQPVGKVHIHHDGTTCDCNDDQCLIDKASGAALPPWTETLLLCGEHLAEFDGPHRTTQIEYFR